MTIKSETMRRMDAMAKAGLTPDLLVTTDTLTSRNGRPVLLRNPRWVELYNSNLIVAAAYDADVQPEDAQENNIPGFGFAPVPTITPPLRPVPPTTITPMQGNKLLQPKPQPEPPEERKPMATSTLITTARNIAQHYTAPPAGEPKPEDAYIAWLLNALADALEGKGKDADIK
jgi:hypothetical protein